MKKIQFFILGLLILIFTDGAFAKNIRAIDLNGGQISEILSSSNKSYIIEFRAGDQIPLKFEAKGDFFDSTDNINNVINIKQNFNLKIFKNSILVSLNGKNYLPLKEVMKGTLSLSSDVDQSQIPGLIKLMLGVYLK